jgi:phage-related minor tail protein
MAGKKSINIFLGLDASRFEKGLKKVNRKLSRAGKNFKRIGKSMTASVTTPLVAMGAVAGKTFMDFEQSMLKVKAISGATGEEFKALEQNAKALGSSTMFTASQVAGLQLELSKLGLTPEQINNSTESILNLAQATDSDLSQAAEVAAKTMQAFGLQATDMTMITDVMADSFSSTALDMGKFETAMSTVGPVAKGAGASLQETTAILGVLVNNGVEASTAGTALRNIFLDLAKEGMTMSEAMDEINNSTNPLATAMDRFGKRGATVATVLANNRKQISELNKDFIDSQGEASRMAQIMDSGLGGSIRRLLSQLEGLAIQIGEILVPIFQKVVGFISKAINAFTSLDENSKNIAITIGIIAASIGPLITLIGGLATAFAFLSTPVGIAVAVLAALSAGFIYVLDNWEALKERFGDIQWWKNALVDMIAFFIKYNPFSALIEAYNFVMEMFGQEDLMADNLFMDLAEEIEKLKGPTKEYENDFGSFGDAVTNAMDKAKKAVSSLASSMGIGGGGTAPEAPTTTPGPQGQMGPMPLDDGYFDNIEKKNNKLIEGMKKTWADWGDSTEERLANVLGAFSGLSNQMQAITDQRFANEQMNIDNTMLKEIEAIKAMGLTEEEEIKRIQEVEAEADKQSKEVAKKQAKANKKFAVFNALIGGAQAVINALANVPAPGNVPFSIVVGALAATQAAAIAAAPLPALAEGGLAFGPTAALVGDNPGANVDPEVIAPLSKLQGMMGAGTQKIIVEGVIRGEDIYLINEAQTIKQKRLF